MNLAFIAMRYDVVGGTERDLYALTEQLAARGHQVTVYCGQVRVAPAAGVRVVKISIHGPGRIARLWGVARNGPRMAYAGGHDLVYAFARCLRQDIIRCGGGLHRTYLQDIRAFFSPAKEIFRAFSIYHRLMLWIERRQYAPGNFIEITSISRRVKQEVQAVFGHADDAFRIIYDGIDLDRFKPDGDASSPVREQHGIPADATLLLFVGKGFERKGLATVLEAMAALDGTDSYLLVVGDDQATPTYQAQSRSAGIADRVVFAGSQKEVERYYQAADLFLLPSHHEAFGNVVLEAMACGVPAIVSRVCGASEILTGILERGILEDPHDAIELTHLIDGMLDPDVHAACRAEAQRVAQGFSSEKNACAIEAQCDELIRART